MKTHRDPQFLDEAEKIRMEVAPVDADALTKIVQKTAQASPATMDYMRKLMSPKAG